MKYLWAFILAALAALAWVFTAGRKSSLKKAQSFIEAEEVAAKIRKIQINESFDTALREVDKDYGDEIHKLRNKAYEKAKKLRGDPPALARFLVLQASKREREERK